MSSLKSQVPSHEQFEKLFINNEKLATIEAHLNRFNPIRIMRMERMEIRHSAILAWLLAQNENHGLGDKFLRAFLAEALRGENEKIKPNAMDILRSDLRDVDVRREWENMDIFLHSAQNRWAIVVENKFLSKQSRGQLEGYLEKAAKLLDAKRQKISIRGVFLTLNDEHQDAGYAPIGYENVGVILSQLVRQNANSLSGEVIIFLNHYIDILEEEFGMSAKHKELEKVARQLYRDHKDVLEFVMRHGQETSFEFAFDALIGEVPEDWETSTIDDVGYYFDYHASDTASFLPESWFDSLGKTNYIWEGCENWWLEYPLVCFFQLTKKADGVAGDLRLYAEVGPLTNYEFRKDLIAAILEEAKKQKSSRISFQKGAIDEGRKYSKFFKDNKLAIKDTQNADEIAGGVKVLLKRFKSEFGLVASILPKFEKYGVSAK